MEEKLKFPMTFTKCPACGSEKRIIETAMSEEQPITANKRIALHVFGVALTDPIGTITRVTVPVLMIFTDACVECGTIYVNHIDKGIGTAQQENKPLPPFRGRG